MVGTSLVVFYAIFIISDTIVEFGVDYLYRNYQHLSPEVRDYLLCLTE